jgi:hypothetical protein
MASVPLWRVDYGQDLILGYHFAQGGLQPDNPGSRRSQRPHGFHALDFDNGFAAVDGRPVGDMNE